MLPEPAFPMLDSVLAALEEQHQVLLQKDHELDAQQQVISAKTQVIDQLKIQIQLLEERIRLLRHQHFGSSSEKTSDHQGQLFNELEQLAESEPEVEADPDEKPKRPKRTGRKGLCPSIPREKVVLNLSDEQKADAIAVFEVKVKEELDIIPARVRVIEYYQEKAVFLKDDGGRRLIEAERPRHPLGKAVCSTNLLAYLITAKYCDGLPLYRQESILKRYGGGITRTTMASWLINLSVQLQPLINLMRDMQLASDYLQGDETRMKVLNEPGMKATGKKWMWVTLSHSPGQRVVLFDYDPSRGKEVAERLLEDFEGRYFQSDGYASYDGICLKKNITQLGCWDHARRKFCEAEKALPDKKNKTGPPAKAVMALAMINKLYRIERAIKDLSPEQKYARRQLESVPALNKLKKWLDENAPKVLKGSLTRDAMDYTLNQWKKLIVYCEDGHLNLSNILAENAIRPFVIGRKAWLFADTPAGAKASALFYSLIETAKANGLEPFDYLSKLIARCAYAKTLEHWEALLPWNIQQQG